MAHHISGFIALFDQICEGSARFHGSRVVPLDLGFGFLPMTRHLVDDEPAAFEHLEHLTARLAAWAKRYSRWFPIAYVETDYFGGQGGEAAVAWIDGKVAFGPVATANVRGAGPAAPGVQSDRAINRAIRKLEGGFGWKRDEFNALGLGRLPSNEAWLTESILV